MNLDPVEKLVWDADEVVGVLGRGEEYVLVSLTDAGPIPDALMEDARQRNLKFCGVLAVIEGRAAAKCEPDVEAVVTMMLAAIAFAQQVGERLKPKDDSADWLERLYRLPDTRQ